MATINMKKYYSFPLMIIGNSYMIIWRTQRKFKYLIGVIFIQLIVLYGLFNITSMAKNGRDMRYWTDDNQAKQYMINDIIDADLIAAHSHDGRPLCPWMPPGLDGFVNITWEMPPEDIIEKYNPDLEAGGRYRPRACIAKQKVAILIPYRNRQDQLRMFLHFIHPFLQKQQLDYGIFVIEEAFPTIFNRGMLVNIGFAESLKLYDYNCLIIHDVDLLPEDNRLLYRCLNNPFHLSSGIDKFNHSLPYDGYFGGVVAISVDQFRKINGFSNIFFGWGGEDDDILERVYNSGMNVVRHEPNSSLTFYSMYKHEHESSNPTNNNRYNLLKSSLIRMKWDGINTLKYKLLNLERRKLYTWIKVEINQEEVLANRYLNHYFLLLNSIAVF